MQSNTVVREWIYLEEGGVRIRMREEGECGGGGGGGCGGMRDEGGRGVWRRRRRTSSGKAA